MPVAVLQGGSIIGSLLSALSKVLLCNKHQGRCAAVVSQLARGQRLRELVHSPTSSPQHSAPGTLQWRFSPGQQSPAGKLSAATWSHSSPFKGHQQQQWRPGSPLSTLAAEDGAAGSEGEVEPFKALQQQLFSDVDAVRKRQKPDFIRCAYGTCIDSVCQDRAAAAVCWLCPTLRSFKLHSVFVRALSSDHRQPFQLPVTHQDMTAAGPLLLPKCPCFAVQVPAAQEPGHALHHPALTRAGPAAGAHPDQQHRARRRV